MNDILISFLQLELSLTIKQYMTYGEKEFLEYNTPPKNKEAFDEIWK